MVNNQSEIVDEKKNRGFMLLVALACFLSNISQLPFFVSAGMTQKLNMPMWIMLLLYIFLKKKMIIPGLFEPPVRTLRATIPENESHIFR